MEKVKRKKRIIWILSDIYYPNELFPEWYHTEQEAKEQSNGHKPVKFIEA